MYRIELRRQAQRSLDKLPKGDFTAITEAVQNLADSPRPKGVEKIKSAGLWRIRYGDYRIVYSIDDDNKIIIILRIGHRREIYRSL
ncbi:MAG: type II toxin-antitoxin system RelE/ParE family toxin [Dehalococcoidales bacterium]|nr:type II toxin-antitoxin system RelE/ParE family toxin [Dehalococcoidales bacterium]